MNRSSTIRSDCYILVVDDTAGVRESVAAVLRAHGFCTGTAANGAEALDRVRERVPSVILSDVEMPVLGGVEFARELQRLEIGVPLVVMTGAGDAVERAVEVGAVASTSKPMDIGWLLHTLDDLCSLERAA